MAEIKIDAEQLEERLARLEQARPWGPRVISKLETFVRSAPDLELFRVNPVQYALERGVAVDEALDLFLHAAKVGLFELDWHVVCPHCGYVIDSLHRMSELRSHYVCTVCASERDYALDDYIQVAFSVSAGVRDTPYHHPEALSIQDLYFNYRLSRDVVCPIPAFPTWRDAIMHVTAYLGYLAPGEQVTTELELPPGVLRATDGRNVLQVSSLRQGSEQVSSLSLRLTDGKFASDDPELQPRSLTLRAANDQPVTFRLALERELPAGKLALGLANAEPRRSALLVYHIGEMPTPVLALRPSLSAKKLLTLQTFRDLFRSELTSTSETLSIKDITFVFTDLKGSTAMYEQIGDAKAYSLVHQHFDALGRVIRARRGAIVKTIGDAVMAVFDDPVDATCAALEMIDALKDLKRTTSQELMLKVGIHRGHSMAVTVNERIDFFGQSVNIAARVQGLAEGNEVYLTTEVYESPGVSGALEAHHVALDEVLVKGVSEKLRVHKIAVVS